LDVRDENDAPLVQSVISKERQCVFTAHLESPSLFVPHKYSFKVLFWKIITHFEEELLFKLQYRLLIVLK